jgi:integrase
MRGHVRRRGSRWACVIDVGNQDGKRRQKWHSGFKTRREAEAALTGLLAKVQGGSYVEPSRLTLGRYLRDEWLPAVKRSVRPLTYAGYERSVRNHITPRIGDLPLQHITPARLNELYADLLERGRADGKGLSAGSVRQVHLALHGALAAAVRWGHITRNVAAFADPPRPRQTHGRVWSADELRRFLAGIAGERLHPLLLVLATTGMRRGEALGGRWDDVDLDGGRWRVRRTLLPMADGSAAEGTPKSARGLRSVALDPGTVRTLRQLRKRQLEERMAWAPPGRTRAVSSRVRTEPTFTRLGCPRRSTGSSSSQVSPGCGCTTCVTAMPRSRSPRASIPRLSRSAWPLVSRVHAFPLPARCSGDAGGRGRYRCPPCRARLTPCVCNPFAPRATIRPQTHS